MATQIAFLQLGVLLLPSLAWLRVFGVNSREALQLRWPTPRGWTATIVLAAGAWIVNDALWRFLVLRFPGAREYADQLREALGEHGHLSLGSALVLVALLPAICEEVAFRGVILAGLRRSGSRWLAVVGSAAVFALFHHNPYHMLVAFLSGLVLGIVALTGSIVPVILMHLVNNGGELLVDRSPSLESAMSSPWVVNAALVATAAGLWLARGSRPAKESVSRPAGGGQRGGNRFPPVSSASIGIR